MSNNRNISNPKYKKRHSDHHSGNNRSDGRRDGGYSRQDNANGRQDSGYGGESNYGDGSGNSFDYLDQVRPKKGLGQHFLTDQVVAKNIVDALQTNGNVLEIGPGMGVLTQYLLQKENISLKVVEIDTESVHYLLEHFPKLAPNLYEADFLKMNLSKIFVQHNVTPTPTEESDKDELIASEPFSVIGNFPYNISSQIFFKLLDYLDSVPEIVCMLQKEVAERLAAPPGSKTYGILSVLLQTWYDIEYLFTVGEGSFLPPPKVKSAVIRLKRNSRKELGCNSEWYKRIIKATFNQRRKTIRNSLKPLQLELPSDTPFLDKRPEQLSVEDFILLSQTLKP